MGGMDRTSPPPAPSPPSTPETECRTLAGDAPGPWGRTFVSLRHRDFRLFWSGAWLSNIGSWMQSVALGWLVLEMTDSSLQLGLVNFASSVPVFFLSFAAGIYADRLDKGRLILVTQVILMALAFTLGSLVAFDLHSVPAILALALMTGVAAALSFPAWLAIISEIVPREDLLNAIALNAAQFQSARLLGPTLAGFIVALSGVTACFYLNAASYLAVLAALLLLHRRPAPPRPDRPSPREEFLDGLRYIRRNPLIMRLLAGVGVVSVLSVLAIFYAPQIAGLLSNNPVVIAESVRYIRISLLLEPVMKGVKYDRMPKNESVKVRVLEVPAPAKVTTEEIMEFLQEGAG